MAGLQNLLTMRFDASSRPKKGVCHLQGLARTSVIVVTSPLGQIWFQSVIQIWRTGALTDRATRKHLFAFSANCDCGASEKTADHIILTCPSYRAPRGIIGLTVLDDKTRCWLNSITTSKHLIWATQQAGLVKG